MEGNERACKGYDVKSGRTPSDSWKGYSTFNNNSNFPTHGSKNRIRKKVYHMKSSSKNTTDPRYAIPHVPFEEFALKKIDELVAKLEKVKPKNSKVDVSPMEDSHHAPCMREMTAVMVHDIDEGDSRPNIYALYECCLSCETAIRVL